MSTEVQIRREGALGRISLDRPQALHALTHEMCETISGALLAWRHEPAVERVVLDHASGRGFCAGGDVARVRRSALEDGGASGRAFFLAEYRLNHLLFTYPKPLIAMMDGVTMGGGAGLALPCRTRIATENTLFAMPEGAIGLFPDVGMGWHLARLPGRIGAFLALTGARLDAAECRWSGIATHCLPARQIEEVLERLARPGMEPDRAVEEIGETELPPARLAGNAERIDRLFAADRFEPLLAALEADPSEWAAKELKAVRARCPTSAKVALRLLAEGAARTDFAEEMRVEFRLAARMIVRPDFIEGVRAVLVDKDHAPQWNPAGPEQIADAAIDALFAPLPSGEEWTPLA